MLNGMTYLSVASDLVEGISDTIPQLSKTGRRALSVNSLNWLYSIDRSPMERDLDFWLANQSDVPFQPHECQTTVAGDS